MSTVLTQSAYARLRGVDRSAVSQWIRRDKLTPPAVTPDGRIDVALADEQLRGTLDLSKSISRGGPVSLLDIPTASAPSPDVVPAADNPQVRRQIAAAHLAELELGERQRKVKLLVGVYVEAAQVRAERGNALAQMVAALDSWLPDLAAELALDAAGMARLRQSWLRFRERQADAALASAQALPEFLPEPASAPVADAA